VLHYTRFFFSPWASHVFLDFFFFFFRRITTSALCSSLFSMDAVGDFEVDDDILGIERLEKCYNTTFNLQRYVLARDIVATLADCGYPSATTRVLPLLLHFVEDKEIIVRQAMAKNLFKVYSFFKENAQDDALMLNMLREHFFPLSFQLAGDSKTEVSEIGMDLVEQFSGEIKDTQLMEELVVSRILSLKKHSGGSGNASGQKNGGSEQKVKVQDERSTLVTLQLLLRLSSTFGRELTLKHVLPRVQEWASDLSLNVRKKIAEGLWRICAGLDDRTLVEKLVLPIFLGFANDEIWVVRKCAVKGLADLAPYVSPSVRSRDLAGIFDLFRQDVSRWVRLETHKITGRFVATFTDGNISDHLVDVFQHMIFQSEMSVHHALASDLHSFAAFSFPAVTRTLGRKRWFQLEKAYTQLVKNSQWTVRRTLASSLHIMAQDLGTKLTENCLCRAFEVFIQDLEEIRMRVVKNIHAFFQVLSLPKRLKYMPWLIKIAETSNVWRIRFQVATQIVMVTKLLSLEENTGGAIVKRVAEMRYDVLEKIVFRLLNDSFCSIRKQSASLLGELYSVYADFQDEICYNALLERIVSLAGGNWNRRLLFVQICVAFVTDTVRHTVFARVLLPELLRMDQESVSNVRNKINSFCDTVAQWSEHGLAEKDIADIAQLRRAMQTLEERSALADADEESAVSEDSGGDELTPGRATADDITTDNTADDTGDDNTGDDNTGDDITADDITADDITADDITGESEGSDDTN